MKIEFCIIVYFIMATKHTEQEENWDLFPESGTLKSSETPCINEHIDIADSSLGGVGATPKIPPVANEPQLDSRNQVFASFAKFIDSLTVSSLEARHHAINGPPGDFKRCMEVMMQTDAVLNKILHDLSFGAFNK
jgi:hypothetical protein